MEGRFLSCFLKPQNCLAPKFSNDFRYPKLPTDFQQRLCEILTMLLLGTSPQCSEELGEQVALADHIRLPQLCSSLKEERELPSQSCVLIFT